MFVSKALIRGCQDSVVLRGALSDAWPCVVMTRTV